MNAPLFTLFSFRVTPLFLLGIVVAIMLALNALLLLLAPGHLDALPRWLRGPGMLVQRQYATRSSTGEIRLTGLLVLGLLSWVVYDMLHRSL